MIFVLDVGNTNIKCGLFNGGNLCRSWRLSTNMELTSDEYGINIVSIFNHIQVKPTLVEGIIISSVIPSINYTLEHMCRIYFGKTPLFVSSEIETGLTIRYDNQKDLGTDRIVNAVAAYRTYGGPCIIVDFGTATTFGAVSKDAEFLGGCICPGLKISTEALTRNAAKLPRVELLRPEGVICTNTVSAMQAGIIFGYVGQVDYIINKMKAEVSKSAKVVATGGISNLIAHDAKSIDEVNPLLTLFGLYYLYEKNS